MFSHKDSIEPRVIDKRMPTDLVNGMKRFLGSGERVRNPLKQERGLPQGSSFKTFGRLPDEQQSTLGSVKRPVKIDYLRPDYKSRSCIIKKEDALFERKQSVRLQEFQRALREGIDSPRNFAIVNESDEVETPGERHRAESNPVRYSPSFLEVGFVTEGKPDLKDVVQDIDARV